MKVSAAVFLVLIGISVVCASERLRAPSFFAGGPARIAGMQPPAQDDAALAD